MGYDATHTFDLIQGNQKNHILYLGSQLDGKEEGLEFGRGWAVMYRACLRRAYACVRACYVLRDS